MAASTRCLRVCMPAVAGCVRSGVPFVRTCAAAPSHTHVRWAPRLASPFHTSSRSLHSVRWQTRTHHAEPAGVPAFPVLRLTSGVRVRGLATRPEPSRDERNATVALYAAAAAAALLGLSYASVPLYQMFCQATGYGGTTQKATEEQFKNMKPVDGGRQITVYFNADTSSSMPWSFFPQQRSVKVVPGETALAFYTAHNPTDKPITGVSTYNVTPMRAGLYFHKIQCFCFEEQRLRPHEEIDMPVFFYIDPKFLEDPAMDNIRSLTLSYTFFRTGDQEVMDIAAEGRKHQAAADAVNRAGGIAAAQDGDGSETEAQAKVRAWTAAIAARTGVPVPVSDK